MSYRTRGQMWLLIEDEPDAGGCNVAVGVTSSEKTANDWVEEGNYRRIEPVPVVHTTTQESNNLRNKWKTKLVLS